MAKRCTHFGAIKSDGVNTVETFSEFDVIVRCYRSRKGPGRHFPARQENQQARELETQKRTSFTFDFFGVTSESL